MHLLLSYIVYVPHVLVQASYKESLQSRAGSAVAAR